MLRPSAVVLAILNLTVLGVPGCARFRIEELKPNRIAALPIARADAANVEQYPQVKMAGHVPYDLPVQPIQVGSRIYMADAERRLVRVFDNSGELTLLVAGPGVQAPEDSRVVRVAAGVPGLIAADEDRTIYIQYRRAEPLKAPVAPAGQPAGPKTETENPINRIAGIFDTRDRALPPSVIVQIARDDKVAATLGQDGVGGAPFQLIYRMDIDPKNRLIVTHRVGTSFHISIYKEGTRVVEFDNLQIKNDDKEYDVRVEEVAPSPAGDFALVCAVYRDKRSFNPVFRKLFRVDSPTSEPKQIHSTDDMRDFCGQARADGGFYMLNSEKDGSRILFKIFNPAGEYVNNRLVRFPGMHASWRRTYMNLDGRIFSSRIYRGQLELYEWK